MEKQEFENLFKNHYQELVRYATTIIKDKDEAEDVVQQVFVSFWERDMVNSVHTSVRSFLFRSVYNACLNRIKHTKVKQGYAKEISATSKNEAHSSVELNELSTKIERAISSLPEQCARIFRMSRFDQLKYQEIADRLDLSVKTVENQMGKALKLLREDLKDYLTVAIIFFLLNQ